MCEVFFCRVGVNGNTMGAYEVMYEPGFAGQLQRDGVGG
jgi:hypothetical protein